jgi:hypothetical protein
MTYFKWVEAGFQSRDVAAAEWGRWEILYQPEGEFCCRFAAGAADPDSTIQLKIAADRRWRCGCQAPMIPVNDFSPSQTKLLTEEK